jgi:hypothetical protein
MAFTPEAAITPDRRGAVSIVFHIPDPDDEDDVQYGRLEVQIKYTDNSVKAREFDLLARLDDDAPGQTHLANLQSLKTYLIARIESELLP